MAKSGGKSKKDKSKDTLKTVVHNPDLVKSVTTRIEAGSTSHFRFTLSIRAVRHIKLKDMSWALDVNPSADQLATWITEMTQIAQPEFIPFTVFFALTFEILLGTPIHPFNPVFTQFTTVQNEERLKSIYFKGVDCNLVERAFKVLDTDQKGYLLAEELRVLLMDKGGDDALKQEEYEDMINATVSNQEEKVYTDDYLKLLQL